MSEPETGPELPEELWGSWGETFGLLDCDNGEIAACRTREAVVTEYVATGYGPDNGKVIPSGHVPVLIGVHPRHRDEADRLRAELATIKARVQFLMGFVDASDPKAIGLSSEHSVGEQIVKLAKLVKGRDV